MFRRQIQSAINEGRSVIPNMQIDQNPFLVHMLELNNPKVLIRSNQAESTKGKNIIISDERQQEEGRQQVDRSDRPQRRPSRLSPTDPTPPKGVQGLPPSFP